MNALSGEELLAWVDTTSERWLELLKEHPEALELPCDVMAVGTVARLLQHVVAVELRYAQRLSGEPESPYEEIGYGSPEEIFRTHGRAMGMLRELVGREGYEWEERISFATRSAGMMVATRRTVFVHTLMHSVRHYAQFGDAGAAARD